MAFFRARAELAHDLKAPPGRKGALWFKHEAIVETTSLAKSEAKSKPPSKPTIDPRLSPLSRSLDRAAVALDPAGTGEA